MKTDKIQELINRENERREDAMLDQANEIIRAITSEQGAIERHNQNIADLRKKLTELETTPINPTSIIG